MPSPFPGIDPFIEGQVWEDFHHALIEVVRESLIPHTRPRYVVRVEERVYVEHVPEREAARIRPDLTVLERATIPRAPERPAAATVAVTPVVLDLPEPERVREAFLTIRERETLEVVTVIEVLLPANKRAGTDGRREYLRKRAEVLLSRTHLVELDLLRGGERLPTVQPLPPADYYAFVCRHERRFRAEVYAWPLGRPLPPIPIPLVPPDPDVVLDWQGIFGVVYDRAGYDYSLDYRQPITPPLGEADAAWAQEILEKPGSPR